MSEKIEGIILRVYQSRESDLVVHLLSPDKGKIHGLARGGRRSKRRFAGSLDIFDVGTFQLSPSRSSLPTIQDFAARPRFSALRLSLDRISAASCLGETVDLLTGEELHEGARELYETYCNALSHLQTLSSTREILRVTCESLEEILAQSGFLNRNPARQPSAKQLRWFITLVENTAEREMKTKSAIELLIRSIDSTPESRESESDKKTLILS
ncbi:MAG: DNA repair protein RecO [Bdellovibrionales bacterium]|nr:DNA repair protein RecO [Bdellovibrionales bacterium]